MATAPRVLQCPEHRFRPMLEHDVPEVIAIEHASYLFPWSEQIFRDCLRVGYHCVVVDTPTGVGGYAVMSMGAGEAHVLNICLAERLRGRGIGRELLRAVLEHAGGHGVGQAFLEVRPSNVAAIALYESMGFERIGLRRGYYQAPGGREDALVYRYDIEPAG
jgi:[ribosomal protein S18]-alanine N-acetyltransferase